MSPRINRTGRMFLYAALIITLVGFTFSSVMANPPEGQAGNPSFPPQRPTPMIYAPVIPETSRILSGQTAPGVLDTLRVDGNRVILSLQAMENYGLPPIQVGDVLVVDPTPAAPDGLLRRVTGIGPYSGDDLILQTTPAALTEAIQSGQGQIYIELKKKDIVDEQHYGVSQPGTKVLAAPANSLNLNNQYNIDGLKFELNVKLKPTFTHSILIDNFSLKHLEFTNQTVVSGKVKVTSTITSLSYKPKPLKIASYTFAAIPVTIGSLFNIWLRPTLNVYLGADGKLSTGISTSVTQDLTINAGVIYPNNQGKPYAYFDPQTSKVKYTPPTLFAEATMRAYVRPELIIRVFGEAGPYLSGDGYIKLEAAYQRNPQWELFTGVKCTLGLKFKIFNLINSDWSYTLCEEQWSIAKATTKVPPPGVPAATKTPTHSAPAPPSKGGVNVLIVYDNISAAVINVSSSPISLAGVEFRRINPQGAETANFPANNWGHAYASKPVSGLPPQGCFMINIQKSSRPSQCADAWSWVTYSNAKYHFWLPAANSQRFQVWRAGTVIYTCEISAGSCQFYLPPP